MGRFLPRISGGDVSLDDLVGVEHKSRHADEDLEHRVVVLLHLDSLLLYLTLGPYSDGPKPNLEHRDG